MARTNVETRVTSINNENYDAIESCPCEEDDDSLKPSLISSVPIYNTVWEPIIIYRKDKKKQRVNSSRCYHHNRIISRTGRATPLERVNVPLRYTKYLRDLSNTMVNGRWRWVTATLVLCFSGLWLLFAWLWMLISVAHGDLEDGVTGTGNGSCTVGVEGFAGFLLMSIETQTTIGYGSRYPTENCAEGVFFLCLQMIMGIGVEGAVLGMFYVKMTRPRIRDCRKVFSKVAVVCQRDGYLCLLFRISDQDHLHIVGTVLRAWLTETRKYEQGEYIEAFQRPLKLDSPGLLLWPLTVVHRIDKSSPLYDVSAKDLLVRKFEIIITLIGTSDSTGQLTQSRTSYLTSEIHWGHRFRPCVYYDDAKQSYVVHQEFVSATEPVDTPLCSAKRLDEVLGQIKEGEADLRDAADSGTSGIGTMTCSSPASARNGWNNPDEILETDV